LIGYCLFHLGRIPKSIASDWFLLVSSFVIPILLLILFPSDALVATNDVLWDDVLFGVGSLQHPTVTGFVLKSNTKVILMTIVYVYIYKTWTERDYRWVLVKFSKLANVFIFLAVIEFLAKNVFGLNELWGEVLRNFFGEFKHTVYEGRLRGDSYELNLFTKEASHFASVLLFVAVAKLANNVVCRKPQKLDISIGVIILLLALSTSFSAVLTIAVFFGIYLLHRWYIQVPKSVNFEKMAAVVLSVLLLSSLTILLNMYADGFVGRRLLNLFENFDYIFTLEWGYGGTAGDNSTQVRMVSMIQTLLVFLNRPVFGYGYNTIVCHSATAMFVSGIGLFGLYCWVRFYFFTMPLHRMLNPVRSLIYVVISMLLFKNLMGGDSREFYGLMLLIMTISLSYLFTKRA